MICLYCPCGELFLVGVEAVCLVGGVVLDLEIAVADPGTAGAGLGIAVVVLEVVVLEVVVLEIVVEVDPGIVGAGPGIAAAVLVEGVVPGIAVLVVGVDPGLAEVDPGTAAAAPGTVQEVVVGPGIAADPGIDLKEVAVPGLADTVEG